MITLTAPLSRRRFLGLAALGSTALLGSPGAAALPPLRREMLLLETYVAGTRYYQAPAAARALAAGVPLALRREPHNPYDALAIEVFAPDGRKLGYVPRADNPPFARLMDAGKRVEARTLAVTSGRSWAEIELALLLVE